MNRINTEQQTYLANQRQKIRDLETELRESQSENGDLKDRLQLSNGQYKQIYNKFNDAEVLFFIIKIIILYLYF